MTYGIFGGDRRQTELAKLLEARGEEVYTWGVPERQSQWEEAVKADVVYLPLPLTKDGVHLNAPRMLPLTALFEALTPRQLVFAPQAGKGTEGMIFHDYFQDESFTIENAAITADCALRLAREQLGPDLPPALVLGFGRIGKFLCQRLQRSGVPVTVAARRAEDRAWARGYGYEAVDFTALPGECWAFGVVFNTVPALVLQGAPAAFCIDLASRPGMVLPEGGLWARGLPGKMAPAAAAQAIFRATAPIIQKRGDNT